MYTYIIPLHARHQTEIYRFLEIDEPWHLIALDSLLTFKMNHPQQRWFGEIKDGKIQGVIFQDKHLVHFAYHEAPELKSPLYPFLESTIPTFTTHGKKEVLAPLMNRLHKRRITPVEESVFVTQSAHTEKLINQPLDIPAQLTIRFAFPPESNQIMQLYQGSTVEEEIDPELIYKLIFQRRVIVATLNGRVVGTIMRLKETHKYSLLGGLYVIPSLRRRGIASLLGQTMLTHMIQNKKKICFYYKQNKELRQFYLQGQFVPLGIWSTYSVRFN